VSLFLAIQVDRQSSPYAYGLVHLSSQLGSLTRELDGETDLFEFRPKDKQVQPSDFPLFTRAKPIGRIGYSLVVATTLVTADEYLFRLLNLKYYKQDTLKALEHFMFAGMTEWSKFAPELMLSHCRIIATSERNAKPAFRSLAMMLGELLSKAGSDYSQLLDEFILSKFDVRNAEDYLIGLCDALVPFVMETLSADNSSQDYRTCLKAIPYIVRLIAKSYSLKPTEQKQLGVRALLEKLCGIVAQVEEDKTKNSFVTTNQRLLLLHFGSFVDDLPLIFSAQETSELLCKFVGSIREGSEQIDRAKLQLLNVLVPKTKTPEIYSVHIDKALEAQRDVMTSLFFGTSDEFAVSFVPRLAARMQGEQVVRLLIAIGYICARRFPVETMLQVAKSSFVSPHERLFVLMHIVATRKTELVTSCPDSLFGIVVELAVAALAEQGLDNEIDSHVYSVNADYSVIADVFEAVPAEQQVKLDLIHPILELFIACHQDSLKQLYETMVKADVSLHGTPKRVHLATLRALYGIKENMTMFFRSSDMVQVATDIDLWRRYRETDRLTECERAEVLCRLLDFSRSLEDRELTLAFSLSLYKLHRDFHNDAEAAFVLRDCLALWPCDDTLVTEKFLEFEVVYARELHAQVRFRVVELLMLAGYHELALVLLDEVVAKCVLPWRNVELLPKVAEYRAKLYLGIGRGGREFPKFYRVGFAGKTFIYRVPGKVKLSLIDEVEVVFSHMKVSSEPPAFARRHAPPSRARVFARGKPPRATARATGPRPTAQPLAAQTPRPDARPPAAQPIPRNRRRPTARRNRSRPTAHARPGAQKAASPNRLPKPPKEPTHNQTDPFHSQARVAR
jgi:hypothetical protein